MHSFHFKKKEESKGSVEFQVFSFTKNIRRSFKTQMHIVYHLFTLFPLCGRNNINEPTYIRKTTIIVNQGKSFMVKKRYTRSKKRVLKKNNI